MKPYTLHDAEHDLRAAIDSGDQAAIERAGAHVDRLDTHRTPPPVLAAALWYAETGLQVFPVQPGQKTPYPRTRGFKDATHDPEQIRVWWEQWPDANVAIATGHLVDVVDIDGPTGQHSRVTHWDMFKSLTVVAKVSTPRPGGMHLYVPASGQGNKAGLLPGIDYRGLGGYVLAAPSTTEQGSYRFLTPLQPTDLVKAAA